MGADMKALNKRHEKLKEDNKKQHDTWESIAKYFNPSLSLLFAKEDTDEEEYAKDVFDTTGIESANTMADGIVGNSISKSIPWVGMYALDPEVNKKKEIQSFFQKVNYVLLGALARSNFYNVISSYTKMGVTIATATMYVEEDERNGNCIFNLRHPTETYIDQDWYGNVDTIYRDIRIGARAAANYFIKEKSSLSPKLLKMAEESPFERVSIRHAVFPAKDEWFKFPGVTGNVASVYWEADAKDIIRAGGFDSFPFVTWRYRIEGSEKYGRGPSHDALPDAKGLNAMAKTLLQAAHKAANPPLNIPAEMKNNLRNKPGGANYYQDPGRIVMPWNVATNYPVGVDQWDRKKKQVQAPFYIDNWKMLSQLTQRMTAIEVSERKGEQSALISTPLGKYESEALDNMLFKVFEIEMKNGNMPDIPNELAGDVGWEYNGVLAQTQKRTLLNNGARATMAEMENIMKISPEAAMVFNWPNTIREIALNNGFPADNLYSEQEVQKQKEEAMAAQQQQQKVDQMEQVGKAMGGANQPIDPESAMAGMMQ